METFLTKVAVAMARGVVIVDENLEAVAPFLSQRNIHVRIPPKGLSDEIIVRDFLLGRIFVTNNSKDFVGSASSYSIGLIATEFVRNKSGEALASIISDALSQYSLWSKRHGFILTLHENGKHDYEILED